MRAVTLAPWTLVDGSFSVARAKRVVTLRERRLRCENFGDHRQAMLEDILNTHLHFHVCVNDKVLEA